MMQFRNLLEVDKEILEDFANSNYHVKSFKTTENFIIIEDKKEGSFIHNRALKRVAKHKKFKNFNEAVEYSTQLKGVIL